MSSTLDTAPPQGRFAPPAAGGTGGWSVEVAELRVRVGALEQQAQELHSQLFAANYRLEAALGRLEEQVAELSRRLSRHEPIGPEPERVEWEPTWLTDDQLADLVERLKVSGVQSAAEAQRQFLEALPADLCEMQHSPRERP